MSAAKDPRAEETKKPEETKDEPGKAKPASVERIPAGHEACFVAIPGTVSKGDGTKAGPGERVVTLKKTVKELEMRGLAFRDESEAKAAYTTWRRKEEARLEAAAEAEEKRAENRARHKRLAEANVPEWQG